MSATTGCVYSSQLSLGLATNLPSGNNILITFDKNYDIMVYNIGTGNITFYTNTNQIIIPNPQYYVIAILNPESTVASTTNVTYLPSNPPSQQLYGFVITQPSSNAGQSNGTYTLNVNGLDVYYNPNHQSTVYVGYGSETPVLSNTLFALGNLIQQLEAYYPLQTATEMNTVANENPICGTLVGSPDSIVFTPSSSGASTSQQNQQQPFVFGTTFYPKVPPLPPAPPSTGNKDLVTLGVIGALAVAGAIVSKKAK